MRNRVILLLAIVIAVAGIAVFAVRPHGRQHQALQAPLHHSSVSAHTARSPAFSHVVIIVEENKPRWTVIGNTVAPYINGLAKQYASASNYFAVTHPSLPNYIALTSGTTAGITTDCNPASATCQASVQNIADRLEQAHKTWKEYAESMPLPCYTHNSGDYAVKHSPFMYYPDITGNASRCNSHVVPISQLHADLSSAASLPDYALVVPNLCNDMHDCSIQTGDAWLSQQVPGILNSPAFTKQNSLLVIAWDESEGFNNNVPLIFGGPAAKPGYVSSRRYNQYSLLHTIEHNWGLQPLTPNDAAAPLMTDLLR